jgi:glycerate kinase
MRFLIAPDKFKGCLSAVDAAAFIAEGITRAIPDALIDSCPIADGGEGTVAALLTARGGRMVRRRVTGPLPEMKVEADFAILSDGTAVIEMSAASGLALLVSSDRNPLNTTTFGTGELIAAAIAEGAKKIIVGLGGSATVDAGLGCAQACGCTILMRDGQPTSMSEPLCGRDLANVLMVKHGRGEVTTGIDITAATDVSNPLFGPLGAPRVFGPQKGATPEIVDRLDADFRTFTARTGTEAEAVQPGAGAAGGLGFGILTFLRGKIKSGFPIVAESARLKERLAGVDLCITAEGRLDDQTSHGKAVIGVARLCRDQQVPCIALLGSIGPGTEHLHREGLTAHFCIADGPMTLEESMHDIRRLLTNSACNCVRLWQATRK